MTNEEREELSRKTEALEKIAGSRSDVLGIGIWVRDLANEALNPPQFEEVTQECGLVLDCAGGEYLFGTLGAAQGAAKNMVGATVYTGTYTYRRPVKPKLKRRVILGKAGSVRPLPLNSVPRHADIEAVWEE